MSSSSPQQKQQGKLQQAPYAALYRVATFLPPASNFRLKQVSRTFCDVVERLTQDWILPFVYCVDAEETVVGLFRFATLSVETYPKKIAPPKLKLRTGKAYYTELSDEELTPTIDALVEFAKPTMEKVAVNSLMPLCVMIFCTSPPITRRLEFLLPSALRVPISEEEQKRKDGTQQLNNNNNNNDGTRTTTTVTRKALLEADAVSPPTVATATAAATTDKDKATENESKETKKEEQVVDTRKYIMPQTFVATIPKPGRLEQAVLGAFSEKKVIGPILSACYGVLPPANPSHKKNDDDADISISTDDMTCIVAKSVTDATAQCGRPDFATCFSDNVRDVNSTTPERLVITPVGGVQPMTHPRNVISPDAGLASRRAFGVRTSASLADLLRTHQSWQHIDVNRVRPFEYVDSSSANWPFLSRQIWVHREQRALGVGVTARPPTWWGNSAAAGLGRFLNVDKEKLLVGENSEGVAVFLPLQKVISHFDEVQKHFDEFWSSDRQKLKAQLVGDPGADMAKVFAAWDGEANQYGKRRLFIADDVTLQTVYAEELYCPSSMIKNPPWTDPEKKTSQQADGKDDGDDDDEKQPQQQQNQNRRHQLPPRLLTPWILIGEPGTFSDEHIEPKGLHVWVHLFFGLKCWFVEAKPELMLQCGGSSHNNGSARVAVRNSSGQKKPPTDHTEWTMIVQRPGETLVIPPDWKHLVLNVTPTFAIARNFRG